MIKVCEFCGAEYNTHRYQKKCCSDECAKLMRSASVKATCEQRRETQNKKKKKRSKLTITEIAVAAKKAGMSYGQYVGKYGL